MNRREIENKQRQLLLVGAAFIVAIVVTLLGYGWFETSFQPPRKTIAQISGEQIKLAEIVPYSALEAVAAGGTLSPEVGLNSFIRNALVRTYASELGIEVTDKEIEDAVISRFEPVLPDAPEPGNLLTETGRASLDLFLGAIRVNEDDYREWLAGTLYFNELANHFEAEAPEVEEQVFVEWIIGESTVTAQQAFDRIIAGEEFADVANDLTVEQMISGPGGVIGWVPKGAIEELDSVFFSEDLVLNDLIGPLITSAGSVVIRVTDGPSEQPVTPVMQNFLSVNAFQSWMDTKAVQSAFESEGLTLEDSQWVIDQIL